MPTKGYEVLEKVKDYAPIRILYTSEDAKEKGYDYGATHCLGKNPIPEKLEEIIKGR